MTKTFEHSMSKDNTQRNLTSSELGTVKAALENYIELLTSPTSADRDANGPQWAQEEAQRCQTILKSILIALPQAPAVPPAGNKAHQAHRRATTACENNTKHGANVNAVSTFLALLATSDLAIVRDVFDPAWVISPPTGDGNNEVVRFSWTSQGVPHSAVLNEAGIRNGKWANAKLLCTDHEGNPITIALSWNGKSITPETVGEIQ